MPIMLSCGCGCGYQDVQTKFVVTRVLDRGGMKDMTTYQVKVLDQAGLGNTNFWIVDSIGKYEVGDVLVLQLENQYPN